MNNFESPASGPLDSAVEQLTLFGTQPVLTDEQRRGRIDAERVPYVLTDEDAAADLAGTPRPGR